MRSIYTSALLIIALLAIIYISTSVVAFWCIVLLASIAGIWTTRLFFDPLELHRGERILMGVVGGCIVVCSVSYWYIWGGGTDSLLVPLICALLMQMTVLCLLFMREE